MREIDLNLLRVFDALIELRSVTRAADRLGLTQSAISHALGRLRRTVDDPLFVRQPGGLQPTARALEIAPGVRQGLTQLRGALSPLPFDPATAVRRFRISAGSYFCALLVPDLAARARARAPGISFSIVAPASDLLASLDEGAVDLALCTLALHHFAEQDAVAVLSEMLRVTRRWAVVSDLYRSVPAYAAVWFATRFTANPMTRHDGPGAPDLTPLPDPPVRDVRKLDKEFIGGESSGAWESITLGCGDADQFRGFVSIAGGKREHRWPCTGPIAAIMIANTGNTDNPIGPLPQINTPSLDSFGSAPERDELLLRNGCKGTDSVAYDAPYTMCRKYTGCPAAYPVVWCDIPNGNHTQTNQGNVKLANAMVPFLLGLPSP